MRNFALETDAVPPHVFVPLFAMLVAFISGCGAPPAASRDTVIACKVPTITRQPETEQSQEKGGIQISVAPATYSVTLQKQVTTSQAAPPFFSAALVPQGARSDKIYINRTTTSAPVVSPDSLRFLVTVNNQMPRVFRGAGTVVQFNVGGKLQAVDQSGYSAFLGTIIPPRQEMQVELIGPPLSSLTSDTGTIGVFLYDVVSQQSEAGVVTEKQNFEWYFDYAMQTREQTVKVSTEEGWISTSAYAEETMQQNMNGAARVRH